MDKNEKETKVKRFLPKEKVVIACVVLIVISMFLIKQKNPTQNIATKDNIPKESVVTEEPVVPEKVASTEKSNMPEKPVPQKNTFSEKLPQLIELGSESCIPCKMMQPILAELRAEYEGQLEVKVFDVYENPNVAEKYNMRSIPTQIFLDREGKEISRNVGFMPKDDILARWKSLGFELKKNPGTEMKDK